MKQLGLLALGARDLARLRLLVRRCACRIRFGRFELLFLILELALKIGDLLHRHAQIILHERDVLRIAPKIGEVRIFQEDLHQTHLVVLVQALG